MTRKEYELVFQAIKSYRVYMTPDEEVLSEKILDDLFYPEFDKLSNDDSEINTDWQPDDTFDDTFDEIVADAEEALANESEIKSLNFR
jgi:hypothetical protein